MFAKPNVKPLKAVPEVFASVTVCVEIVPTVCAGKVSEAGVRVTGSWQALVAPNKSLASARQIFPKSPAVAVLPRLPGQAVVATK
jgi:hypothetical protein